MDHLGRLYDQLGSAVHTAFLPTREGVWRKPMDVVVIFKTLVLSALYNLSDDQIEYQVRDRLSFMRFLELGLEDRVPDAKTIWLYREALSRQFDGYLARQGYIARGEVRSLTRPSWRCRATTIRAMKTRLKAGEEPEGWADKPAKRSQKNLDARWTKKHGKSH